MKKFTTIIILALMTAAVSGQSWTELFSEDFEDGNADIRWTVVEDGGPNTSAFAYDYVTGGLPAAPNGGGLGLKYEVNLGAGDPPAGTASQIYAFPTDKTFTAPYRLQFDLYMYYDGTSGSTEYGIFGVMHTSTVVPSDNGIDYAFTCDNGSSKDVYVYEDGLGLLAADGEGGYTALDGDGLPTQNILEAGVYESAFTEGNGDGDNAAPWDAGNEWLTVTVDVKTDSLIWAVNGVVFSKMEYTPVVGNIALAYMDIFSSISASGNYAVYDNVKVLLDNTGIRNNEVSSISIYPNPVSEVLNVVVPERSTFELINTIGQAVLRTEVEGTSTVDVSSLKSGMYFARIASASGKIETQKIMVK